MRKYRASLSLPLRGMALAASLALVVSVQAEEPLSVEAESISYSDEGRVVSAEGNVRVKWGENQLSGDSITIEQQERRISGQGGLRFETPDLLVRADRCRLSINDETGQLENVDVQLKQRAGHFGGRLVTKQLGRRYQVEDGFYSSCRSEAGTSPDWSLDGGRLDVEVDGYGRIENGTFRIKGVPVLYIPYAVFPTRMHRTSGLLVPRLGSSDERGFVYSQPFYWAIDKHRDLTLTANIETAARAGLGVEYRYRNSRRSGGRIEVLYFNDRVGGEPATNVVSPQFSGAQVPANRGLLRLRHRQAIDPQTSFYADLFAVSDDVFLRDVLSDEAAGFAGRRLDRTRRYTVSRVGVAGGRGTWSYGLEDSYYQDLIGPDRFTLQRPLRLWSVVDHDLPGGFFYTLAGTADSFRRRHGVDGDRLSTVLTLERPGRFGALETSLWTRGSLRAYRMTDRNLLDEDGNFVARVQANPLRAVFESGAELSSTLGRRWPGRESGADSLEHRIKPFLRLRHRSGSSAGLPLFDGNDAGNRRTVGSYGLVSELIGQGEEGPARELASLSVAQSYNFSQRVLADHFSDIDATLYVSPRPGVFVGGALSYNVGSDVLTGANAKVGLARVLAPWVSTRPSKLEAAYRFVRGGALETIQGRLALAFGHRTTVGFVGRYDVVSADFVERGSSVKIESDCGCWSVDFGFVSRANPDENQFRVLVELGGLGSLGTSILRAPRPGLDRSGPAGGLWRPGW